MLRWMHKSYHKLSKKYFLMRPWNSVYIHYLFRTNMQFNYFPRFNYFTKLTDCYYYHADDVKIISSLSNTITSKKRNGQKKSASQRHQLCRQVQTKRLLACPLPRLLVLLVCVLTTRTTKGGKRCLTRQEKPLEEEEEEI